MKKALLNIAFAGIVLLLALPGIQMMTGLFREKPLNGAFTLAEKPAFTVESWMDGNFQSEAEQYMKDRAGFRNFLVRLQNEVTYSLFNEAHAEGAVVGKAGQLYEYDYIRAWLAEDYPGDSFADKKLIRLKYMQEYLKREKGIDLVLVFEPGKASFYPEFIPDQYVKQKSGLSSYERFRDKAKEYGVDFIDFQQYFLELKQNSQYPLFPKYGTHWSVYGMHFAADSLLRFIEQRRGIHLTRATVGSVQYSTLPLETDDDVLKTMNTLIRRHDVTLAYPRYSFDTIHPGYKPMILAVADSYYWNIFNTDIPKYVFANQAYWYFNSQVYPDYYLDKTTTKDLNLKKEVEKQQVIFLMVTERFVHKFDWKLIDQLCDIYAPPYFKDPVYQNINNIMQVEDWYNDIIDKSIKKKKPLEETLIAEGKFLYKDQDTAAFMLDYGVEYYEDIISADSNWMSAVREKARMKNISDKEMLQTDAKFMFGQRYPEIFAISEKLHSEEDRLTSNADSLARIMQYSKTHYLDPERYIRHRAWENYKAGELAGTREAILRTPHWLEQVKQKAAKKGISLDEMIREDAIYIYNRKLKSAGVLPIDN
jgi:hypothetical protein